MVPVENGMRVARVSHLAIISDFSNIVHRGWGLYAGAISLSGCRSLSGSAGSGAPTRES